MEHAKQGRLGRPGLPALQCNRMHVKPRGSMCLAALQMTNSQAFCGMETRPAQPRHRGLVTSICSVLVSECTVEPLASGAVPALVQPIFVQSRLELV